MASKFNNNSQRDVHLCVNGDVTDKISLLRKGCENVHQQVCSLCVVLRTDGDFEYNKDDVYSI